MGNSEGTEKEKGTKKLILKNNNRKLAKSGQGNEYPDSLNTENYKQLEHKVFTKTLYNQIVKVKDKE